MAKKKKKKKKEKLVKEDSTVTNETLNEEVEVLSEDDLGSDAEESAAANAGDADSAGNEELEALRKELDLFKEKNEELENRYKMALAELQNQKKRLENEFQKKLKFALEDFFKEFIKVKDAVEQGIAHLKAAEELDKDSFVKGIELIDKEMEKIMEKFGVKGFSAVGETFTPERHLAVKQVDVEGAERNEVVEEYQKGYFYHDRLLRPAMVVVATGESSNVSDGGDDAGNEDDKNEKNKG